MTQRLLTLQVVALSILVVMSGGSSKASSGLSIHDRSKKFADVQAQVLATAPPTPKMVRGINKAYNELFSSVQSRRKIATFTVAELELLFRASSEAQFYTLDLKYVRDMQLDLDALQNKGRASQTQYIQMNNALIASRMFSQARTLEHAHPGTSIERFHSSDGDVSLRVMMVPAPTYTDETQGGAGPTEMVLSSDGRELRRRNVNLSTPAQILVVISPQCHFAQGGLREIETDPLLRKVFEDHATWLVPPMGTPNFDAIAQWNRAHPHQVMDLAYRLQEWPMLDRWETPTFYFFRQGKVVAKVVGWPRRGRKPEVRSALKLVGLL